MSTDKSDKKTDDGHSEQTPKPSIAGGVSTPKEHPTPRAGTRGSMKSKVGDRRTRTKSKK
jgi:hypothetical protein